MTRIIRTLFLLALYGQVAAQQMPYRTNLFTDASFIWNPAMTAAEEYMEASANYRRQWLGFENAPRTATAAIQYPFVRANMSLGGYVLHDEIGPLTYTSGSIAYSYKIRPGLVEGDQLAIGLMASLGQYRFDGSQSIALNPNDALLLSGRTSQMQPNLGAGIYYISAPYGENGFFLGLAAHQLLASDLVFEEDGRSPNLQRVLHGNALLGVRFYAGSGFVELALWAQYAEENVLHAAFNLRYELEEVFWAGLSYYSGSTAGVQAGLIIGSGFLQDGLLRVGFQGTYNIGQLGEYQGPGLECYLAYRFNR